MKLTKQTFNRMIDALKFANTGWKIPDAQAELWRKVIAREISEEFYPMVILDWISHVTTPPKGPAEIIKYANEMVSKEYGSADAETELLISSSRDAYYATEDFQTFEEAYAGSFEHIRSDMPAQEAYIKENVRKHSSCYQVLILVYDELKGEIQDCFKGDAEHGIDFLRTHIKKTWNAKSTDAAKQFLISGKTDIGGLTGGNRGMLEG